MRFRVYSIVFISMLFLTQNVYAQKSFFLPHIANGNFGTVSFRTTFILFNNSDVNIAAALSLTDNGGSPMTMSIGGLGTGSQFNLSLNAGATGFFQTDGLGSGVVGAARVTANATVGVSAIFTVYDAGGNYLTEAGVGSSDLLTQFVLPVDSTGSFLTGLALFNPPGADASVTLTLLNTDGSQAGSVIEQLKSGNHTAVFLAAPGQLFPTISNFRGTLLVQSTVPIAALVLRQYQTASMLSYTSLPVVSRSSSKSSLNLAHVANGSYGSISFKTSFLIFNISSTPANVTLALTQDNGSPFTITIPGSGAGTGTNSSFSFTLAAGASVFLQTDGLGAGTSGAATVTSNVPVGASAIFTVLNSQGQFQTEAGVGDSPMSTSMTLPVDVTGSFDTGVAFFNPGSTVLTLAFKLMDANGILVNSITRSLSSKSHLATFVDNLFAGVKNFRGSLAVSSTGSVAATTLRQYASGATYTTLPTASGTATGRSQATPLLTTTVAGLNAIAGDPDIALNEALLPGSVISGTITGAGRGLLAMASDSANNVYSGQVNPLTSKYLIVVPDGVYNLTVCYQPTGTSSTTTLTATYADPTPIQVVSNAVRDVTLPDVVLYTVSGTVSGLASLPSGPGATIVFTSNDSNIQGRITLDAGGNYQGVMPSGSYTASVSASPIQFLPLQTEALELYAIGSLAVVGGPTTANFALPSTAKLSGTISGGSPSGTLVSAIDTSAPATTQTSCCTPPAGSTATADATGNYQMILAANRSFAAGVMMQVSVTAGEFDTISYPLSSNTLSLGGDTTLNFSIPAISRRVQIYGNVNDGQGHVLADVVVTAYSQSITGAANVGFSTSTKTDIYGNYRLLVPGGTNYRVTFVPPAPTP